jgi:uncharacterized protein YjdB
MELKDRARTQDQAWYVKEWNKDRGDYQPVPITTGKTMTLAPEDSNRLRVTSDSGDLQLLDGRDRAQNGWFVLRTLFAPSATEVVWHIQADVDPGWTREANIGHSQAGYATTQSKVAVIESDPKATAPAKASLKRLNDNGTYTTVYTGNVGTPKQWLRYAYRNFDFSSVKTPGMYVIEYAGQRTEVFPIADDVYDKSWQQSLTGFLAKEMDHIAVRETYKIVHAASHMDDSIMWPLLGEPFRDEAAYDGSWFDGQDFSPTARTNTNFDSLEHIPGLAVGGWYDAGDYDLEATRQAGVIQDLAIAYREFEPDYDTLDVSWDETTGGMVELHRPDGTPDLVQQVQHGALNVLARLKAIGYNFKVVEVPTLRQYTHLGDGSAETDNYIYDPALDEDEVDGLQSGKQDDRLAMVGLKDPTLLFNAVYALAAAASVIDGYDNAFAAEALAAAKNVWDTEDLILTVPDTDPSDFWAQFAAQGQMAAEWNAAIELLIATGGEQQYIDAIKALWPLMKVPDGWFMSFGGGGWKAALVLDYMDEAFQAEFREAIATYKASYDASVADNPYGVASTNGMWGGSTDVVDMGEKMYFLHKVAPEIISADYTLRAATYILGTHPDNDTSWLSGVGTSSVEHAYGNTRADDTYVAGGIVPGYVPIMPDLPEAKDEFGMMWFESEYVIDTAAKWVVVGNAISALALEEEPVPDPAIADAKAVLGVVLAGVADLTETDYTPESWAGFASALSAAEVVAGNQNATLGEIQVAITRLTLAASLLNRVPATSTPSGTPSETPSETPSGTPSETPSGTPSETPSGTPTQTPAPGTGDLLELVNTLISATSGLQAATYTPASWTVFAAALTAAKNTVADKNATSDQIKAAYQALAKALAGLAPAAGSDLASPPTTATTVVQVKAGQKSVNLVKGKSITISAKAYTNTGAAAKVAYKSSNTKVATVNASGKITAKKVGKTTVTIKAGTKAAKITVKVVAKAKAKVKKVSASGVPKTLTVGATKAITGKYTPATATSVKLTYKSSKPTVASIDAQGIITAKAAGKTVITVKGGTKTTRYTVQVN